MRASLWILRWCVISKFRLATLVLANSESQIIKICVYVYECVWEREKYRRNTLLRFDYPLRKRLATTATAIQKTCNWKLIQITHNTHYITLHYTIIYYNGQLLSSFGLFNETKFSAAVATAYSLVHASKDQNQPTKNRAPNNNIKPNSVIKQ